MRRFLPLVTGLILATPLSAQTREEMLGRVDAIVGDSIITNIDLEDALLAWSANEQKDPPTDSLELLRLKRELLQARIDQLLLVQAAAADTTLRVSDEQVNRAVDGRIQQLQRQMGGIAAFEQALAQSNLTPQTYRQRLVTQQRREALIQNYVRKVQQLRKPPPVTEEEIQAFFDENRDRIGMRPPTISFRQVVMPVEPSAEELAATRAKADSILALANEDGADFAQLARRFSEDPGSKDLGGDLGFNRPGVNRYYLPFERALFAPQARPGMIIGPVRTPVGLHIIKIERIRGAERQARHILIRWQLTDEDTQRAIAKGDSVADALRAGADVDSLAAQRADPDELVRVGPLRQDSLPPAYQRLASARDGEVVGPFELTDGPAPQVAVAQVTQLEAARPATVDDYRATIQEQLAQTKLMDELLQELRRSTYIEVRLPEPGGGVTGGT